MSEALIGFGDLLASSPAPAAAPAPHTLAAVAVLTASAPPQPAAAAIALALADACRTRAALVSCVEGAPPGGLLRTPASVAAAARLRREGLAARPCGRLVWLPAHSDQTVHDPEADAPASDPRVAAGAPADPSAAAALAARLRQAARRCGLPAVIGIGGPRSGALDRVLAGHDGIVVVLPAAAASPLVAATLDSLARVGPPAAAMSAPRRLDATGALAGLHAPRAAAQAVAAIGLGAER